MNEVLIVLVLLIGSSIIMALLKKNIFMKVYNSYNSKNYGCFFKYVDSLLARVLMPIYTREVLKFNVYIQKESDHDITNQFNRMMKLGLTSNQLKEILVRGFNYFCIHRQDKRCKKILAKMREVLDEREYPQYRRHYEILFNGSTEYINELEREIKTFQGMKKGYLEYLLAKSYQAKKEQKNYLKYINQAMEDCKANVQKIEQNLEVMW